MEGKVFLLGVVLATSWLVATVDAQAFSVALTNTFTGLGKLEPVPFDKIITNDLDIYDETAHCIVGQTPGIFYFVLNAGREPGKGVHYVMERDNIQGVEVRSTDTSTNGIRLASRGVLTYVQQGVRLHMIARLNDENSLQGDTFAYQTGWSGFYLNDLASTPVAFSAALTQNLDRSSFPIVYDTEILNVGLTEVGKPMNMSNGRFRTPLAGIYFFHLSTGAKLEREVRVNMTWSWQGIDVPLVSLYRTSRNSGGIDTLSRSVLVELAFFREVRLENDYGSELYSDAGMQTSFSGFLYSADVNPGPTHNCFFIARTSSWDSPISVEPFHFDQVLVYKGSGLNETTSVYTCTFPGSYFFSLSAGAQPLTEVSLSLRKNAQPEMRLESRSTTHNGIDTFSRDVILNLALGDVIHVQANGGTATYSDNGLQTSLMGMRIR